MDPSGWSRGAGGYHRGHEKGCAGRASPPDRCRALSLARKSRVSADRRTGCSRPAEIQGRIYSDEGGILQKKILGPY